MRQIKFRAWDKEANNWKYGYLIVFKDTVQISKETEIGISQHNCIKGSEGQFTGLKDKKGKEIYEGDIILTVPFKKDKGCMYEIVYVALGARFDGLSLLSGIGEHLSVLSHNCEVIGNIYENPELIKC